MSAADERAYRRIVRQWALGLTVLSALWGAVVLITGGVGFRVFGLLVRSHNPQRIFLVTLIGFVAFTAAGGRIPWRTLSASIERRRVALLAGARTLARVAAAAPAVLAALLSVSALYIGLAFNTNAIGGADSYGYVSQAHLLIDGRLKANARWVERLPWPDGLEQFTPLGYTPRHDAREGPLIVPTYSPGLPMVMAVAEVLGGQRAIFAVVPILGALLALATYGIGSRLASPAAGLIGTWLLVTSPVFVMMLIQPMSDVPTATFWALAFYLLLRPPISSQLLAGVAAGIAVLIRPNLAFGVPMMVLWRAARALSGPRGERRAELWRALAVAVGALPAAVTIAALNDYLNGSPLLSGYGPLDYYFAFAHLWPNLARYPRWFVETETVGAIAGVIALALPLGALWPEAGRVGIRSSLVLIASFVAAVWVTYFFYLVFDAWWFQRFLLPTWPFFAVGVGAVAIWIARRTRWVGALAVAAIVIAMGQHGLRVGKQRSAFDLWRGDRHYPIMARLVRESTDPRSVILSMQHSGSLRYYAGRMTMRYDWLGGTPIDRIVDWFAERRIHVYVVLDDWELAGVKQRFRGQRAFERLNTPLLTYLCGAPSYLYDLSTPASDLPPTRVIQETWGPFPLEPAHALPDLGL
jgi:hypothetical protein